MMARRLLPLTLSLVVLGPGCYSSVDSYVPALAKQSCKRLRECNRGQFDDRYDGDLRRCRDNAEDDLFETADNLERGGWDYDDRAGRDCIAAYRDLRNDCSSDADRELNDVCLDVLWDGF